MTKSREPQSAHPCHAQCRLLAGAGLGSQLFFQGDDEYTATLQTYYSGESREITPPCILKPDTAQQVSVAIKTLNSDKAGRCWDVAIRAGGHSNFVASNTASGVTIDLGKLNTLEVNVSMPENLRRWHGH